MVQWHAGDDLLYGILQARKLFAHLIVRRAIRLAVILAWRQGAALLGGQVMLIHEAVDAMLTMSRVHLDEAVNPPSEETLKKAAAGDRDALGDIYSRYYSEMQKVARGRARGLDQDAINDLVQDFFADKVITGKLLKQFMAKGGKPNQLVRWMAVAMTNTIKNANMSRARHSLRHKPMSGAEPAPARTSQGTTAQIVRAAVQTLLNDPSFKSTERDFIKALMVDPSGAVSGGKGGIGQLAAKYAPKSVNDKANWGTKAKKRFLKRFCADKGICKLVRSASPDAKRKASAFCKGVKGSCVEMVEVFFALHPLLEAEERISEDTMEESVLDWLREFYGE